ncbi:MAG: calcium-binding protein [Paracoccaceae bacterium]
MFRFVGRFESGNTLIDAGIREISAISTPSGHRIVAYSGTNGGVSTFGVDAVGRLSSLSTAAVSTGLGLAAEGDMAVAILPLTTAILTGATVSGWLTGWIANATGTVGPAFQLALPDGFGATVQIAAQPDPSSPLVLLSPLTGRIAIFNVEIGAMVDVTGAEQTLAGCTDLVQADVNGQRLLIAIHASGSAISVHRLDSVANSVSQVGMITQNDGLAVAALSDLDVVRSGSDTFVIAAGAGSSSLTVMRLSQTGQLTLTDHILDSRTTRFQTVLSVDTIEINGHVFVVAGGGDDGITLFRLLPNGTLQVLATLEDSLASGLSNVTAVKILQIDDRLLIYIGGEGESGLTVIEWALGTLGEVINGTGRGPSVTGTAGADVITSGASGQSLFGGSGNDILVANTSDTRLTGGDGADVFMLGQAALQTTIADFQRGLDVFDPSGWPMLRDASQLTVSPRSDGLSISFFGRTVVIQSADGLPLNLADVLPDGLAVSRIAPSILTDRPEGGSDPGEGDGGTSPGSPVLPGGGTTTPLPPVPTPTPALVLPSAPIQRSPLPDWSTDPAWANGATTRLTLTGTGADDTLNGASGRDWLDSGAGNDLIHTGFGADTVLAGIGNDTIFAAGGNNEIWAGAGDDIIRARHGDDTIGGGPGNDLIDAGGGRNTIWSLSGHDTAMGGSGADQIGGGPGNDQLYGFGGDDLIFGGLDHDTIHGGSGHDTIWGGAGNDLIAGGMGNDSLVAGDGTDHMWGDAGADTFVFYRNNGTNYIRDFNAVEGDQIHVGRWMIADPTATGQAIVQQYGRITPDGALLDFGDASTLIIFPGMTDLESVADSICLF